MSYKKKSGHQYRLDRHAVAKPDCRWCKGMKDTGRGSMHCDKRVTCRTAQNVCKEYEDVRFKPSRHHDVADFEMISDSDGVFIKVFKGDKWFTLPEDTDEEELAEIMLNFDKEWQARVGQNLE